MSMPLQEIVIAYPKTSIIVISALVSLFITIVNHFMMDKERMRELKAKQKSLQADIKNEQDPKRKMDMTNEMLQQSMETMKHSLKPALITMVPLLIAFWFIKNLFVTTSLGGHWIWYYIGGALVFSLLFRKLFKLP